MATEKQLAANRRNAGKSTGPRTRKGKLRSRENAIRHGLTAETIITVFENQEDYARFENAIVNDFDPRTAIERHLVARLVSLLWRLRRAEIIETGLFSIQADIIRNPHSESQQGDALKIFRDLLTPQRSGQRELLNGTLRAPEHSRVASDDARNAAHCFLRLACVNNGAIERINRYEMTLWRQVAQTLLILRPSLIIRPKIRQQFHCSI